MPAASAGTAGLGGGPGVGCCSCRVGRPPCRVSHTRSRPARGRGGVGWGFGEDGQHHCTATRTNYRRQQQLPPPRHATAALQEQRGHTTHPAGCQWLPCGPFQRAAENVTAPPLLHSVLLLLLLSSAARGCTARLPSTAAVSSSRRSAAAQTGRHADHADMPISGGTGT
jgi:hypothetical protein